MINDLTRKHVSTKLTRSKPSHPWINTHLNRLTGMKKGAYQRARKTNRKEDKEQYR